jgi:hypothetical protein
VAPAKPAKALIPNLGKTCWAAWAGGRSLHRGQEQSCRQRTERDGGRHPGSRKASTLRGALVEREPRSVHVVRMRILSCGREHRRQRMSEGRRGGERCRRATFQGVRTGREGHHSNRHFRSGKDRSFSRSFDPCASIVTTHRRPKGVRWWRGRGGIDGGQTCVKQEEPTAGSLKPDAARLAARSRSLANARERASPSQNRKMVEAIVPARNRERGLFARTSKIVSCRSR